MHILLKTEDTAKLVLSYLGSIYLGYDWWVFFVLLLTPDVGMLGYLVNTRVGAITYNLLHHQGVAIVVGIAGVYFGYTNLQLAGLLLFGHSAMDRALGYGLKYSDSFKHTHLGWIGPKQEQPLEHVKPV